MNDGAIVLKTYVDNTGVAKGVSTLKGGISSLTGVVGKLGVAMGIAFGVKQLIQFGKESAKVASDLTEVQNVVDVAFGGMSGEMNNFAETAIETFGMSELTAKKAGSSFMAMAKGMKMDSEQAKNMAISLTGLTGDMASFYNISQDEAKTALSSVFTGETETLKRYGILITEVNLQEFARQKGITKSISKMTQQEKVMLRYNYVMQATNLAQGDFIRTQDSWANQTRILSERWAQLKGEFGKTVITVGSLVLPLLNSAISGLTKIAELSQIVAKSVYKMFTGKELNVEQSTSEASAINEAVSNQEDLTDATKETAKEQAKSLANFDEINKLSDNSDSSSDNSSGGMGNLGVPPIGGDENEDGDTSKYEQLADKIINIFKPVKDYLSNLLKPLFGEIKRVSANIWNGFKDSCKTVFDDISKNIFPEFIETYKNSVLPFLASFCAEIVRTIGTAFESLKTLFDIFYREGISPILQVAFGIFSDLWSSIKTAWDTWGAPIFEGIRTTIETLTYFCINTWINLIKPIFDNVMKNIRWLWSDYIKPLIDNILDMIGELITGVMEIYNKVIAPIVNWVLDVLAPPIVSVANYIMDIVSSVFAFLSGIANGVITMLKGIIQFVVGVFTGDWGKAWEGVKNIFKSIWDGIVAVFKFPINIIIDTVNFLIRNVTSALNYMIRQLNNIHFDIPEWAPVLGGKSFGINLNEIGSYQIPKLAKGAVIPANKEFLAVLGDQKHGTNIEAPLETIEQAVSNVLGTQQVNVNFTGSVAQLVRLLQPEIDVQRKKASVFG